MKSRFAWLDGLGDSADALYVVDHEQRLVRWNGGAERLLGYREREVLGRLCYEVTEGCDEQGDAVCQADCAVQRAIRQQQLPGAVELQARARNGQRVWLRVSIIVVPQPPGALSVHVLHDIGADKRASQVVAQVASLVKSNEPEGQRAQRVQPAASGRGDRDASPVLTLRERDVLRLLADGLPNQVIARRLGVSCYTVRNHVQHVLDKLGVHTRAEAVSHAFRRQLLL
jgi:PAS domain S-box-containing protein